MSKSPRWLSKLSLLLELARLGWSLIIYIYSKFLHGNDDFGPRITLWEPPVYEKCFYWSVLHCSLLEYIWNYPHQKPGNSELLRLEQIYSPLIVFIIDFIFSHIFYSMSFGHWRMLTNFTLSLQVFIVMYIKLSDKNVHKNQPQVCHSFPTQEDETMLFSFFLINALWNNLICRF